MTIPCFIIGHHYHWKRDRSEVLTYLGKKGVWNQFARVGEPEKECYVLDEGLHMLQSFSVNYSEMVHALAKPGEEIVNRLSPMGAHMLHMAVGISGEAGELLDSIKKTVIYNKPIDRDNIVEELGDLEFYMEGLRQRLNITREQCIDANIAKLSKRYSAGRYSDNAAQERADKRVTEVTEVAIMGDNIHFKNTRVEDVHEGSEL